jgi:hypothetical protein
MSRRGLRWLECVGFTLLTVLSIPMLIYAPITSVIEIGRSGLGGTSASLAVFWMTLGAAIPFLLRTAPSVHNLLRAYAPNLGADDLIVSSIILISIPLMVLGYVLGWFSPASYEPFVDLAFMGSTIYNMTIVVIRLYRRSQTSGHSGKDLK